MRVELKEYVEKNILPEYAKNDEGHGIEHIQYVIRRSLKFASMVSDIDIHEEMVYVIACYHDIGHSIDPKNHEKVSADILRNDSMLKGFFSDEEIEVMAEAVEDHRASLEHEPRSIYGKIVSSADKNGTVDEALQRTYTYRLKHYPNSSLDKIIEDSRQHLILKFGENGYAREKMYFEDEEYRKYLEDLTCLTSDKELFATKYKQVNHLKQ